MKEIILMSPQLKTTDYIEYDEKTTFEQLLKQLKTKYENDVISYVQHFSNIRKSINLNQITVKLHYIDEKGIRQTLGLKTLVNEITKKKVDRIYWEPEPIGGYII
ncbi:MAG: hypothetical protein EAX96_15545 [Candidatus Lokiarchaeota archaeon]|nr:hypothetical protein [Candidatus Lokiarchaeota archaeon]